VPEPRRTPLVLPTATLPPPTAEPTATRGPLEFVGHQRARIVRVWDGQSALLDSGLTVRYLGLQAPGGGAFGRSLQPFGREAAQRNAELVEGRDVELEQDVTDVDGEGQLPRYVFVEQQFVNEELLLAGLANAAARAPDLRRQDELNEAEREAREARRGIWLNAPTLTRTPVVAAPRPTARPAIAAPPGPSPTAGPSPTPGAGPAGGPTAAATPAGDRPGSAGAAPGAATTPGPNPAAPAGPSPPSPPPAAAGTSAPAGPPAGGARPAATPASGGIPRFGENVPPTPGGGGANQP
jgi:endonuclease YncB( thermonuclease family)